MSDLHPEDTKLVVLARSVRARTGAAEGAAVRDADGRTYAAATVALPSLSLSALQVAVAMAASSGATGLEAAAVLGNTGSSDQLADADAAALRDLGGADVPVLLASTDGTIRATVRT